MTNPSRRPAPMCGINLCGMDINRTASGPPQNRLRIRRTQEAAERSKGASRPCLTREVAQAAGLSIVGKQDMISASETTAVNTYLFSLGIPVVHEVDPTGRAKGSLAVFPSIEGMEFNAVNTSFGVLLGMDILSKCAFKMDFDGHFSLCW